MTDFRTKRKVRDSSQCLERKMKNKILSLVLIITIALVGLCGCSSTSEEVGTELFQSEKSESIAEIIAETIISETTETITEEQPTLSLIMVGDILLHDRVQEAALQEDGSYNYEAIFANVKEDIQAADFAIVNQEVIIGGEELGISGYPAFNTSFTTGDALVDAGFDIICHGTNHALDKGKKGLLNCINFWTEHYPEIGVLGIHDSKESQDEIYVYDAGAFKIAVLNYTYGTNGIPMPEGMPYAVDLLDEAKVIEDIQKAEEIADFTIVAPHWGTEYQLAYSGNQEKWAKLFAANGVDLVIGTHPHVIQPIEWVIDEATGHEMLVYYSLGNFVNWTGESGTGIANRMVGGMAEVTLAYEDGEVVILEYGVEPVISHLEQGINGVTVYKLADYTEELASRNQIIHQDSAFSLAYCQMLCEDVFGCE